MTQQFFITVNTTGLSNANKYTRHLSDVLLRRFNNTSVQSVTAIYKIHHYIETLCKNISETNKRIRPIKVGMPWENNLYDGCSSIFHLTVKIDCFSRGDNEVLQVNFLPVRHNYIEERINEDLDISFDGPVPPAKRKMWDPAKAKDGDIIAEDYYDNHSDILIFKKFHPKYEEIIIPHAVFDELGFVINKYFIGTTSINHGVFRYATDEERGIILNELHVKGYHWDEEGKQIIQDI